MNIQAVQNHQAINEQQQGNNYLALFQLLEFLNNEFFLIIISLLTIRFGHFLRSLIEITLRTLTAFCCFENIFSHYTHQK